MTSTYAQMLTIGAVSNIVTNIKDVPGVIPPASNQVALLGSNSNPPIIGETEHYTVGLVSWEEDNGAGGWTAITDPTYKFKEETVYRAYVRLAYKAGYTGGAVLGANYFTVAGATSTTHTSGSTNIYAVFPATAAADAKPVGTQVIPGVVQPAAGAAPVTLIDAADYTGTVTWSPMVTGAFAPGVSYTATITLMPKPGSTMNGVVADYFKLPEDIKIISINNAANSGVVKVVFPETVPDPVNIPAIAGVTPPVAGAVPVTAITETAQYTGAVAWTPAVAGTFAPGTVYTARITLTPKTGYSTGYGVAANFFTVAGAAASNPMNSGVIAAVFPATATLPVNNSAIAGVTPPVAGAAPVTAITETAQYTGTVSWSPAPSGAPGVFAYAAVYTATINLTPKAGYTLSGVTQDFFTVAGAASVSNAAGSGAVTAVFPATASTAVSIFGIGGIAPVARATAATTIAETAEYTGTIAWSPALPADGRFARGAAYTATITLIPKTGYTLSGVAQNSFAVEGAATTGNAANSGVITAAFPATASSTDVCEILDPNGNRKSPPAIYSDFGTALAEALPGETIRLLDTVDYNGSITVDGRTVTIDLAGDFVLNVTAASDAALLVTGGGEVRLAGDVPGRAEFSVASNNFGGRGVEVKGGGKAEVSSARGSDYGALAVGSGSYISVKGDSRGVANDGKGAAASGGASIMIGGDAIGAIIGAQADTGASVVVRGDATGYYGAVSGQTAATGYGSRVTVEGSLSSASGIIAGGKWKPIPGSKEPISSRAGYIEYKEGNCYIWVRDSGIDGIGITPAHAILANSDDEAVFTAQLAAGLLYSDISWSVEVRTAGGSPLGDYIQSPHVQAGGAVFT
ncbi:MAG: hypothetical protein FWF44_11745, partial [Defluviitaleaceae bacterium]|nr:hypothetical protein [Defluviitaleaceae bacterium]